MLIHTSSQCLMNRIDPRVRLLTATLLAFTIAFSVHYVSLLITLPVAFLLVHMAGVPLRQTVKRLSEINFFMLFLFLFFPFSVKGDTLFQLGIFSYSMQGFEKSLLIALKANTIMISVTGLVGTMEAATLGRSMQCVGVPKKFVHLFLFMVRYIDVIGGEFVRLRNAMKLRSFQTTLNMHTFKSYGNLIGMVLVRSIERSERIMDAMKCRGFNGTFYSHARFQFRRADLFFVVIMLPLIAGLVWLEFFSV